jgi:hypothetical protein
MRACREVPFGAFEAHRNLSLICVIKFSFTHVKMEPKSHLVRVVRLHSWSILSAPRAVCIDSLETLFLLPGRASPLLGHALLTPGAVSSIPGARSLTPRAVSSIPGARSLTPRAVCIQSWSTLFSLPGQCASNPGAHSSHSQGSVYPLLEHTLSLPGQCASNPGAHSLTPRVVCIRSWSTTLTPRAVCIQSWRLFSLLGRLHPLLEHALLLPGQCASDPGARSSHSQGSVYPLLELFSLLGQVLFHSQGGCSWAQSSHSRDSVHPLLTPRAVASTPGAHYLLPKQCISTPGARSYSRGNICIHTWRHLRVMLELVAQPSTPRAVVTWICVASDGEPNFSPCSRSEALAHAVRSFFYSQGYLVRPVSSRLRFLQTGP